MSDTPMIHVIDDEEALRRSVRFLLETSGHKVTTWASGVAFLAGAPHADAGCVLLDVRMPDMDGLEVQRAMAQRGIAMPVIILTGHGDIPMAVTAMKAGAVDFVEKPFEKAALIETIDCALGRLAALERARHRVEAARRRIAALSPREQDVLAGLVKGWQNKAIASDLEISPRTVEVHRANLMTKLGVDNLSDALRLAFAAEMIGSERSPASPG